jgi:hypothetical protein
MSRSAAKDSFAPAGAHASHNLNHGLQPWLRSFAANAAALLIDDYSSLNSHFSI